MIEVVLCDGGLDHLPDTITCHTRAYDLQRLPKLLPKQICTCISQGCWAAA